MARLASIAERLGKPGDYTKGTPPRPPVPPKPVKSQSSVIKKPPPTIKVDSDRDDESEEPRS